MRVPAFKATNAASNSFVVVETLVQWSEKVSEGGSKTCSAGRYSAFLVLTFRGGCDCFGNGGRLGDSGCFDDSGCLRSSDRSGLSHRNGRSDGDSDCCA